MSAPFPGDRWTVSPPPWRLHGDVQGWTAAVRPIGSSPAINDSPRGGKRALPRAPGDHLALRTPEEVICSMGLWCPEKCNPPPKGEPFTPQELCCLTGGWESARGPSYREKRADRLCPSPAPSLPAAHPVQPDRSPGSSPQTETR